MLGDKKLVLFFTQGVSLRVWHNAGILEREIEAYKRLLPNLGEICFLTYGDRSELHFLDQLSGIRILFNRWGLSPRCFGFLAPLLYQREMSQADFFKTNQLNGSWTAAIAKFLFRKKLIVRCGYLWSAFRAKGFEKGSVKGAEIAESVAFRLADAILVTAIDLKEHIIRKYGISRTKVKVIPNAINTDVFRPLEEIKRQKGRICFIGRLSRQKNPLALLEAVQGIEGGKLVMIGDGPLRAELERKAQKYGVAVEFTGTVPNYQLAIELNRSEIYASPTLYEGSIAKTALEAMACGMPIIVADSPGVREVLNHRQNAFLCGTSPGNLRAAIREVMTDERLKTKMGFNAREFVVEHFALERVVEMELALLSEVVSYPPYDSSI